MMIIAFLFILVFFNKENRESRKTIYIYGTFLILYSIFHHLISLGIDNSGYKTFSYNLITELFYIIRMTLPIIIIYITYTLKPKKDEVIKLFLVVSAVVSTVIVGSNLIECSLASYGGGTIKGNIFDWFFNTQYPKNELASKGWFNSANQISGLMYILFPICVYSVLEKASIPRVIITLLSIISMLMLGTRVASYGWFLIIAMMVLLYLFFVFIIKNLKFNFKNFGIVIGLFGIGLILMTHAPLVNVATSYTTEDDEKFKEIKEDANIPVKEMLGYIGMNNIYFEKIYPYEDHKEFWKYVVDDVPATKRVGNRNSQQLITDDVADTYKNIQTNAFGLGYSRFINAYLYLEKDFIIHYHTIGIFGIILFLLPYVFIALYSLVKMLKFKKINLFHVTIISTLILPLCISYFSGHIVDELIITLYLGFIAGYLVYYFRKDIENEKVSVIIPAYNAEGHIAKTLDSILKQTLNEIEIIVVNDGSKDNTLKILKEYEKKYPDKIKVIDQKNSGPGGARNAGIKEATGEYIGFLDSDDTQDNEMYEEMYKKAKSKDYDMVACDVKMIYPGKTLIIDSGIKSSTFDRKEIKMAMIFSYAVIWNKIIKKDIVKSTMFTKNIWYEDVEFLFKLFPKINSIGVVKKPFCNYMQTDSSITNTFNNKIYDFITVLNMIVNYYKKNQIFEEYKEEIEYSFARYMYGTFIKRMAKTKDKKEYNKAVNRAITEVEEKFPNYKKNIYLNMPGAKNIYLKNFNKTISKIVFLYENRINKKTEKLFENGMNNGK